MHRGVIIKALIVGIDPGVTTGVAILDSDGKLLDVWSKRSALISDVIKHVVKFGKPVIIATDVSRPPKNVSKVAAKFGSKVYLPSKPLPVLEKSRLVKLYAVKLEDRHETDALAAATKAFHIHQEFFGRVREALKEEGMQNMFKDVVELLLSDESENIANAIIKLRKK
jgi:predicted RNase H-like nuclease (RuvC/YqgF family)